METEQLQKVKIMNITFDYMGMKVNKSGKRQNEEMQWVTMNRVNDDGLRSSPFQ